MEEEFERLARVKTYVKLIRMHFQQIDSLLHLLASEQDSLPDSAQLLLVDAARKARVAEEDFRQVDARLSIRTVRSG